MSHDIEQAKRFLTLLDETAEQFTFQTFDDKPSKNPALARWMHGDIDALFNELVNYNKLGAGVFVMVQGGDGSGRNIKAVNKIRCVFNENDRGVPKKQPLEPQIVVESSPGKAHYYFLTDGLELDDFKPIQGRLIADYGSDPQAHDLPRVMRLPGFYHNKREPHFVSIVHESGGQPYTKEQIFAAFPPYIKEVEQRKESPVLTDKLSLELRSALGCLRSADYAQWVKIGLALSSLGDTGRGLWLEWGQQDACFDYAAACEKWNTFKPDTIGYKTVFAEAQAAGWANTAKKQLELQAIEPSGLTWLCADKMADNATAPVYLINKIIEADSHGLLAGGSMAFKTFVDLRLAYSICTGVDFFGHQVFNQGKVLYICGEGKGALSRRMKALKIVEGDFLGNLLVLEQHMTIDNAVSMAELMLEVQRLSPVFVIFDTFSSLVSGIDENSNSEVARALKLIKETCAGSSSLIVHHYGKDATRGSRGAGAFKANVDFELSLVREPDTMNTVLSCVKMKDGELFSDINLTAHIVDLGLVGQDGHNSCSLVLKSNIMALSDQESKCLQALKDAIILDGVDFEGGCGASEGHWRKCAYKILTGKNKPRDFSTAKKKLLEIGRIEDKNGLFCA